MDRDPWIALDGGARDASAAANVVRIPVKPRAATSDSETLQREVAQTGDRFVNLIDEIAEAVARSNERSDAVARRAVAALQKAEARIGDLEARLVEAEARVEEANGVVARLHGKLLEGLERFASPSSAA